MASHVYHRECRAEFVPTVLKQDGRHLTGSCEDQRDSDKEFALKFTH